MSGITKENIKRYERLLAGEEVDPDYRQAIVPGMAQFYYDNDIGKYNNR